MKIHLFFPLLALGLAVTAEAAPMVETIKTHKGQVLAGEKGMTLYTYRKDTKSVSNCYDQCAANWPPFLASDQDMAEGKFSIVTRKDGNKDGKKQWARDGMPLYYWAKDTKQGEASGDGIGGVWHAAKP